MQTIVDWSVSLMGTLGPPGVALAILIETIIPPVPSELFLPLAGFTATTGEFSWWSAVIWATGGSVLGAFLLYWAGAALGAHRVRAIADKIPLTKVSDVDKALDWFDRHGEASIFLGRMVPGIRSIISIPAGLQRMPIGKFALYTTAGSAIWNGVLVYLGVLLGEQWHIVGEWIDRFSTVIYIVCALVAVGFVAFAVRRWLRERAEERDRKANRPRVELLELDGDSLDDDPATAPENPDVTVSDADGAAGEGGEGGEGGARP
ncbi:DedA family protein [Corynebacterium xerosis]|uniref:DedA family protein n=2 Tax=Corynebacterium xerosis TaxID=1725 RepID=UPI00387A62C8